MTENDRALLGALRDHGGDAGGPLSPTVRALINLMHAWDVVEEERGDLRAENKRLYAELHRLRGQLEMARAAAIELAQAMREKP